MEETRGEQVAFGWAGEGTADTGARSTNGAGRPLDSAAASRRLRSGRTGAGTASARGSTGSPRADLEQRPDAKPRARAARTPNPDMALPPDGELWDVQAAARFLKRSVSWVYHRAEDGTLPVKRLAGWGVRFIPSELRAWVQEGGARRGR